MSLQAEQALLWFVTGLAILLVLNALMLWLAVSLVPGFEVVETSYVLAALLITLFSWLTNAAFRAEECSRRR